jgi:capsular exopolysaccharide synthesis family protein
MNETPTRPAELSQFTSPSLETGSTAVVPAIEPHKPVKINKVAANPAPTPTASAHEAGSGRKSKRVLESDYDQVKLEFQFHRIVQQLEVLPSLEAPLVIGVASTLRGEGRSTIALGLASAISQEIPLPVVLIETDLSKPALAEDLNMPNKGLSEYLRGEIELDDLIQSTALADLAVIVSGDCQGQALKLLRSERLTHLLSILSQQFAAVVLDLPPMSQAGESARVISQIDRVLMVVEAGSTPKNLVKNAMEMIPEEKLAGVLLNRTRPAFGLFQWIKRLFR